MRRINRITRSRYLLKRDRDYYQRFSLQKHFDNSGGNLQQICNLLRQTDIELTANTRHFIAGLLDGTRKPNKPRYLVAKRKPKKTINLDAEGKPKNTRNRDKALYFWHLYIFNKILDEISTGTGIEKAKEDVAERMGITEDNAKTIYQRFSQQNLNDYL
jgi:hypothetical protein